MESIQREGVREEASSGDDDTDPSGANDRDPSEANSTSPSGANGISLSGSPSEPKGRDWSGCSMVVDSGRYL